MRAMKNSLFFPKKMFVKRLTSSICSDNVKIGVKENIQGKCTERGALSFFMQKTAGIGFG